MMSNVATIGLDIAKSVFQVHGVNAAGGVAVRRKLTRGRVLAFFESLPRCLVGIEACSSSHYWARELIARGHDVRLLPAQYVKPYLKRQKNDAADAEAICEAVTRPTTSSASLRSGPEPREWHYGQRHRKGRTYRSDTWPHQPATAEAKKPLANGEPSIHGPKLDSACTRASQNCPLSVFLDRRFVGNCARADGRSVAVWLVRNGHAMDWPTHTGGAYSQDQAAARADRVGIWQGEVHPPWEDRAERRSGTAATKSVAQPLMSGTCDIKGNISNKGERIYHMPGQRYYARTRVDPSRGERMFCSEAEARQAGWRRSKV
jgi:hypothetical protein